ncbi:hypothetical protein ACFP9V_01215 [Deinococcus radiopugnans]|uniref:hypothetical protein n=1 Tax=Deinococcus radiopugnans TaxID=57497 RepID=UPI00360F5E2F
MTRWVYRGDLHADGHNPSHVARPELERLKIRVLEDGWTQPIVRKRTRWNAGYGSFTDPSVSR